MPYNMLCTMRRDKGAGKEQQQARKTNQEPPQEKNGHKRRQDIIMPYDKLCTNRRVRGAGKEQQQPSQANQEPRSKNNGSKSEQDIIMPHNMRRVLTLQTVAVGEEAQATRGESRRSPTEQACVMTMQELDKVVFESTTDDGTTE